MYKEGLKMKSTAELENEFKNVNTVKDLDEFMDRNKIKSDAFGCRLKELCQKYGIKFSKLIHITSLSKSELYAMKSGNRNPTRESVLKVALAIGLTKEETNELLKLAKQKELYLRIQEDRVILTGLKNKMTIYEIEELLINYNLKLRLLDKK